MLDGETFGLRTTVGAPDADTGECDKATREVAAMAIALKRENERRTQGSCG